MTMIDPPIDVLATKTYTNKYILCNVVAKRAKHLQETIPDEIEASDKKAISIAAEEILNGDVVPSKRA